MPEKYGRVMDMYLRYLQPMLYFQSNPPPHPTTINDVIQIFMNSILKLKLEITTIQTTLYLKIRVRVHLPISY